MSTQQDAISLGRRRVVLGLTGLIGVAVTSCSLGGTTSTPVLQKTPVGASQLAITPTPKIAPGTTLYVYQKHTIPLDDVAWSPDSTSIISVGNGVFSQMGNGIPQQSAVWDARTGESNSVSKAAVGLAPLAWSPDGKMIAMSEYPDAGGNNDAVIYEAQTGKVMARCSVLNGFLNQLTWSPDSRLLAIAGGDDVEIFNVSSQQKMLAYPSSLAPGTFQSSNVVAWSPDGNTIASAAAKNGHSLQFWDAHTGAPLHYFLGSKSYVAAWSPDGKAIVTGNPFTQAPQVLDSSTGQVLLTCQAKLPTLGMPSSLYGTSPSPHTISWSPDSTSIAVATDQNQVQIWDVATQKLAYTYTGHSGPVSAVAWSPDGSRIASASYDKTVRVWQAL